MKKLVQVGLHIFGWILFFCPIIIFIFESPDGHINLSAIFTYAFAVFCFVYLFIFYLNIYVLIPDFFLKKKYLLYFSILIILFFLVAQIKPFNKVVSANHVQENELNHQPPPQNNFPSPHFPPPANNPQSRQPRGLQPLQNNQLDIISVVLFITVWAVSAAYSFIKQWRLAVQKTARAENEKTHAELAYLKAQINPHFLFNTLNSIYSLAIQKSDKTAEAVVKLSELMRYIIRDANHQIVALQDDLNYIANYIELQKTRLGDTANIFFEMKGDFTGKKIAPLLLISFIENAFKYGVNPDENSEIKIEITFEANDFHLYVFNKKVNVKIAEPESGTGIENSKTRLELLYHDKYKLEIADKQNTFSVDLLITLE